MTEETEQNINETLTWLRDTGTSIQDFTLEQAPLYCQEVLAWQFWSGVLGASVCLLAFIAGCFSIRHFVKEGNRTNWNGSPSMIITMIVGICGTVMGLSFFFPCSIQAAKAKIAPRAVLVEHFKGHLQ